MFFSEIGDIRATLCTIEACTEKRQVKKHLITIQETVRAILLKLSKDQK